MTTDPRAMIRCVRAVLIVYALVITGGIALYVVVGLTHH
jgi:hypothetical protein